MNIITWGVHASRCTAEFLSTNRHALPAALMWAALEPAVAAKQATLFHLMPHKQMEFTVNSQVRTMASQHCGSET